MPAREEDFSTYEILVNIWRLSGHVYHSPCSQCHCSFHLKECIIKAKINWNDVDISDLGVDFNPVISFDREPVVKCMKKIAEQSSQNLKRNADAFLAGVEHGNDSLLWSGGRRTVTNKFSRYPEIYQSYQY